MKKLILLFFLIKLIGNIDAQSVTMTSIEPTPFMKKQRDKLIQLYYLHLENKEKSNVTVSLKVKMADMDYEFNFQNIAPGKSRNEFYFPEVAFNTKVQLIFKIDENTQKSEVELLPQRHWTIHLFPFAHTDNGYSDLQTRVARNRAESLDSVIRFCKETDNYPDGCKYKWNEEITWSLDQFVSNRSESEIKELVQQVKNNRVEIGAWNFHFSDLASHESIIRMLYKAQEFRNKYDIPFLVALNNDITGLTWAAPQILNKAGIKYFITGINQNRSKVALTPIIPFYWEAKDGSKLLVWNGENYMYANYQLKLHQSYSASFDSVSQCLQQLQNRKEYPFPYDMVAFSVSGYWTDNSFPNKHICDVAKEWSEKWEYPKIKISLLHEFFTEFENKYATQLPTYSKGWPDFWTDGSASTAAETGINRITQNEILSAEKLSSVASMLNPKATYPFRPLKQANDFSLLYIEHSWGSWQSILYPEAEDTHAQRAVKASYTYIAKESADDALQRGLSNVSVTVSPSNPNSIIVYNTQSWTRTDIASLIAPKILNDTSTSYELVDARTQKVVPFQINKTVNEFIANPSLKEMAYMSNNLLLFTAENIPSMGFATYYFRKINKPGQMLLVNSTKKLSMENTYFKITVDSVSGGLSSIFDKELNVELVDSKCKYTMNQYVYENPTPLGTRVHNIRRFYTGFNRQGPTSTVVSFEKGEVFSKFTIKSTPYMAKSLVQEVIVYNKIKKIEFINTYDKIETLTPEAVYFSYPFVVPDGSITQEIADGTMKPEFEQFPQTSRDFMAVQNWVDISNKDYGVLWTPLEVPLTEYGDINTGKWLDTLDLKNKWIFSYMMNNYFTVNWAGSQGGLGVYRYYITSHKNDLDKVEATHFGASQHHPLLTYFNENAGKSEVTNNSFFNLDKKNVIIQTIKKAEDGNGYIIRLREIGGFENKTVLSSPLLKNCKQAFLTSITETNHNSIEIKNSTISFDIKPYEILTFRIKRIRNI